VEGLGITQEVRNSLDNVIKSMEKTEVDDASLDVTRRESNELLTKENSNEQHK
jgi:uncharacterized protein YoxC